MEYHSTTTLNEPAAPEVGTLRELNVKPGDVVIYAGSDADHDNTKQKIALFNPAWEEWQSERYIGTNVTMNNRGPWCIISRAAPTLPHGHARLPSGEVVDLTAITTPFGLLPDDVQEALRDHGGPWEAFCRECGSAYEWRSSDNLSREALSHRVRPQPPAPKVEEVVLYGRHDVQWVFERSPNDTHRITFNLIDGEPDVSSVRMVKL